MTREQRELAKVNLVPHYVARNPEHVVEFCRELFECHEPNPGNHEV